MEGGFYNVESMFFRLFGIALCGFQAYTILFTRLGPTLSIE